MQRKWTSHRLVTGAETTDSSDRLALPDTGLFLENDSPLDVETAARENQLTPKANQERNK
ncbi:hypothetical protein BFINE_27180 [Bacteroides finegoldii DSM 17565]|nr:hypothetical protein BFINE_27180 [Bacteroides finegoldii DSM 17565]